MNVRVIIIAVIAIIGMVGTYFLSQSWLSNVEQSNQQQAAKPAEDSVQVLIAAYTLHTGSIIKAEDFKWTSWPKKGISEFYLTKKAVKPESLYGKVVRYAITASEPITMSKLVSQGEQGFLAATLNPEMRAITVGISNVSGVAGFVLPGDRVDIILTHKVMDETNAEHMVSETILQNIRVLAIDQRSDDNGTNPIVGKTATLEVTPKIAEKFTMLTNLGQISLALRSLAQDDATDTSTPMELTITRTWDKEISPLFGEMEEKEKKQEKASITINRAGTAQTVNLEKKPNGDDK